MNHIHFPVRRPEGSNQVLDATGVIVAEGGGVSFPAEHADAIVAALNGWRWRDPVNDPPEPLKVVIGFYGQVYFLVHLQKWGWSDALKGGKIAVPLKWCDIPSPYRS